MKGSWKKFWREWCWGLGFALRTEHEQLLQEVSSLKQHNGNIEEENFDLTDQLKQLIEKMQQHSSDAESQNLLPQYVQLRNITFMLKRYLGKGWVEITNIPASQAQCLGFVTHSLQRYAPDYYQPLAAGKWQNTYDWKKAPQSVDMQLRQNGNFNVGFCRLELEPMEPKTHRMVDAWRIRIYFVSGNSNNRRGKLVLEAETHDFKDQVAALNNQLEAVVSK